MNAVAEPIAATTRVVPLVEAVELNPRSNRSALPDASKVSFVPMAAVEAASGRMDATAIRPFSEIKKGYTVFREGDVLFAKITPCMENGKIAVARGLHNGVGCGSTEFHVLRPRSGVDPHYIYHFVSSARFRAEAAHHMTGAVGQKRVPTAFLEHCEIPLPDLDEQRRILAELEKQFSRLDEAVANLKRVKTSLRRYKAAVLADALEGTLAGDTSGWRATCLGTIASSVRNGISIKPIGETGTRILRISAVRPMALDLDDVRYVTQPPEAVESFRLGAGDVLFTRYNGSVDLVGVCAAVPELPEPTVYPDKLIRVRVPSDVLLPSFLVIAASTGEARAFIGSRVRTTAGQAGVSGADVKAIPLRVPPLGEQHRIVAEVDRRLSIVREVEAEVDANLKRAHALRQAVLAKAFRVP